MSAPCAALGIRPHPLWGTPQEPATRRPRTPRFTVGTAVAERVVHASDDPLLGSLALLDLCPGPGGLPGPGRQAGRRPRRERARDRRRGDRLRRGSGRGGGRGPAGRAPRGASPQPGGPRRGPPDRGPGARHLRGRRPGRRAGRPPARLPPLGRREPARHAGALAEGLRQHAGRLDRAAPLPARGLGRGAGGARRARRCGAR